MADRFKEFRRYATDLLIAEQNRRTLSISGPTPLALVYPNQYTVGMASLGYQTVYRLFNESPIFACERAFVYEGSFATFACTLETQRSLRSYRIIAFSISYEPDYLHVLQLLRLAGIPLRAAQRSERDPLIIMGGVTMFSNPTVMAPVADIIFLGEAESLIPTFAKLYAEHGSKSELLSALAQQPGFYVPSISQTLPLQVQHWQIAEGEPATSYCIPEQAHLKLFMIEVGRGCGRGCRFCSAGHVYHPFRFWPAQTILATVEKYARPGDRIGLVGAALSDYADLDLLCNQLLERGHPISLSSLRMDRITDPLLQALEKSGLEKITLAPEAGSERLRRIIGKNLTEEQIFAAVDRLAHAKIKTVKLYFMIGLPFETSEDSESLVDLSRRIAQRLARKTIRVGLSLFIPKPCTPFQWAVGLDETEARARWKKVRQELARIPRLTVSPMNLREDRLQMLLSLGDAELGRRLTEMEPPLSASLKELTAYRSPASQTMAIPLPWDIIDCGQSKEKLWTSWQRAVAQGLKG